jgi:LPXTG-motif cell wall-anchored protein/uncharacterized repeat protein (TIGR01451 family)
MKSQRLGRVLLLAVGLILLTLLSLMRLQQDSQAQGGVVLSKTLNRASNVVRVGEVLSFTVNLTNNAGFTLTRVRLVDAYENTVLGFAGATPAPNSHNAATGEIIWDNVASPTNISPGASLTFTIFFTAEHPRTAVVNAVRAEDITGTMGSVADANDTERVDEAIGGAAPVVKFLSPPGSTPQAGLPVTFTHIITNDGAAVMTRLPLTDTYDPNFLEFNYALPFTPDITTPPGTLAWTNLASVTYFGPIAPDSSVVITTVFTATTQVVNTVNRASTEGALDQFNNDLAAGSAEVPITIIGDTPTPVPDDDSDDDDDAPTATPVTPTATPIIIQTLTPTPLAPQGTITAAYTPLYLPETGRVSASWLVTLLGISLMAGGGYLLWLKPGR